LATTSLRPLFGTFAEAGVFEALQRGVDHARRYVSLPALPAWLWEPVFAAAVHAADPSAANMWVHRELQGALDEAERQLRSSVPPGTPPRPPPDTAPFPPWAATEAVALDACIVAAARLRLGAVAEAANAVYSLNADPDDLPRAYADGERLAVWTSAHAAFLAQVQSGVEEPPPPSMFSVPNALSEFDWSDLFSRRSCPAQCGSKTALPMLQVLMRSTNPGQRGWNTLLETSLRDSTGVRYVISSAIHVCLAGMHAHLHPSKRPRWPERMRILHTALQLTTSVSLQQLFCATAGATKEAVRRLLAGSVAAAPALLNALAHVSHPVGQLRAPPTHLPAVGMESAMLCFLQAGQAMAEGASYHDAVSSAFAEDGPQGCNPCGWVSGWLGKGTASVHTKVTGVSLAADVWSVAFRSNFLPFWAHGDSQGLRVHRLDPVQYHALHALNACTKLVGLLPEEAQLRAQRAALAHVSAGILTIEELAAHLEIPNVKGTSSNGGAKGSSDALSVLSADGAESAARLLVCARAAWVSEQVLIVELGPRAAGMQIQALFARLGHRRSDALRTVDPATVDAAAEARQLPFQATQLHTCLQCKRISNACCTAAYKASTPFNELGASISMLDTDSRSAPPGALRLFCAKRSSAAYRTALSSEQSMLQHEIEQQEVQDKEMERLVAKCAGNVDAELGVAARAKRDSKSALEQRSYALGCGAEPMLAVPLLGRAVRVHAKWYGLCCYCGACIQLQPHHRFQGELCCGRCDADMLGLAREVLERTAEPVCICRFCGVQENDPSLLYRWKSLKAPLDFAGKNRDLPPPLRTVSYCSKHYRAWLPVAHRSLPTRVILSHIGRNARPVYGAAQKEKKNLDLGLEMLKEKKKRGKRKRG
tara:strand:+ start:114 stop:2750 length:2637 start_codon:yes stop_codon:yes gene_type:complete